MYFELTGLKIGSEPERTARSRFAIGTMTLNKTVRRTFANDL